MTMRALLTLWTLLLAGCMPSGSLNITPQDDDDSGAADDDDATDDDDAADDDDVADDDDAADDDDSWWDDDDAADDDDSWWDDDDSWWDDDDTADDDDATDDDDASDDDDIAADDDDAAPGYDGTYEGEVVLVSSQGWDVCEVPVTLVVSGGSLSGGGTCTLGFGPGSDVPLSFAGAVDGSGVLAGDVTADLSNLNQTNVTSLFDGAIVGDDLTLGFEMTFGGFGPSGSIDVTGTGTAQR